MVIGKRNRKISEPFQRLSPLQDYLLGICKTVHLDAFVVIDICAETLPEGGELGARQQIKPALVEQGVRSFHEQSVFITQTKGFAADSNRRLERLSPEVDCPAKIHQHPCSHREIVKPVIHLLRQHSKFICGFEISAQRHKKHGCIKHVSVGRFFHVSGCQRETDHCSRVQESKRLIAGKITGGMEITEQFHHRPRFRVGHCRNIDERIDRSTSHKSIDRLDLLFESGQFFLTSLRKGETEQRERFMAYPDGVKISGKIFVLQDHQIIRTRPVEFWPRAREEHYKFLLCLFETSAQIIAFCCLQTRIESESVIGIPAVFRQQSNCGIEIAKRRFIGCGGFCFNSGLNI